VFEFRIYATGDLNDSNPPAADQGVGRYQQLHERESTLRAAGWTAWPTVTGLAFRPPDACPDAEEVGRRLRALGITEPFDTGCGMTWQELLKFEEDTADLCWYHRATAFVRSEGYDAEAEFRRRPRAVQTLLRRMHKIEQQRARLPPLVAGLKEEAALVFAVFLRWIRRQEWPGIRDWKPGPWWDSEVAADEAGAEPAPAPEERPRP
jgi:hypothetical protein